LRHAGPHRNTWFDTPRFAAFRDRVFLHLRGLKKWPFDTGTPDSLERSLSPMAATVGSTARTGAFLAQYSPILASDRTQSGRPVCPRILGNYRQLARGEPLGPKRPHSGTVSQDLAHCEEPAARSHLRRKSPPTKAQPNTMHAPPRRNGNLLYFAPNSHTRSPADSTCPESLKHPLSCMQVVSAQVWGVSIATHLSH
jgi:hypothetical protein